MTTQASIDLDSYLNLDSSWESNHESLAFRSYSQDLMSHPDCTDPSHPGCPACVNDHDLPEGAKL